MDSYRTIRTNTGEGRRGHQQPLNRFNPNAQGQYAAMDTRRILFVPAPGLSLRAAARQTPSLSPRRRLRPCMVASVENLGLTPALSKLVDAFANVPDPKLRYQQLLFFAKQLPPMDPALKTDANRVRGCTSVVHVDVNIDKRGLVRLAGDSDAQLTKGLLALLVNGLDGAKPDEVCAVNPGFISTSGLAVSLTPSRNNGFVNMLAKIQDKVNTLVASADSNGTIAEPSAQVAKSRPVYTSIMQKLAVLKPETLDVIDDSAQHAGHAGAKGYDGESHFSVRVVAEAFDSLGPVQRHRLIYTLLNEEMDSGRIHALQIDAMTPGEASS